MLTIEKFYFKASEAQQSLTMGSDSTDYSMNFLGVSEHDSRVSLKITVRGREEFRAFIEHLHRVGMFLSRDRAEPVAASEDRA